MDAPFGSHPDERDCDVLVVGYGPVGQVLAILLAQHGWRVTVVEQWPEPYPMPRAVAFDGPAARILAAAGIAERIGEIGEPTQDYVVSNGRGQTLLRIPIRRDGRGGWPDSTSVYQPGLEAALAERGSTLPTLRVLRGLRAVEVTDRGDTCQVVAADTATGVRRTLAARWVVGCDGANSLVRDHLGATLHDAGFALDWMACDVVPHDLAAFPPCNVQIADPARPRVAVSAGPGHRRWEFMRLPGEPVDQFRTVDSAWRLLALFGVTPHNATLTRHAVYTFSGRNADRWRSGRMLLAGDAAHQMPPFAGQGMCSGIRDAANLAWKLHLVLAGVAGEALLDSYSAERRPQVQRAIDLSVRMGRLICLLDVGAAAGRDAAMLAGQARGAGPAGPGGPGAPGPGAAGPGGSGPVDDRLTGGAIQSGRAVLAGGVLAPQYRAGRAGQVGRFDEVVGPGFVLLAREDPADLVRADQLGLLRRIGAHLVHLVAPGTPAASQRPTVVDVDGEYLRWLDELGAVAVLVRPDFHVFGAGADRAELATMLAELHRHLAAAPVATGAG